MVDEAFALSPISARAVQPSEEDYDAISQAFMETSRGRWFLGEYAKRNRNADTRMVLDAVARIEETLAAQNLIAQNLAAQNLAAQNLAAQNLAAQQQPLPNTGLADALAALRRALDDARGAAELAMEGLAAEPHLAPIRKGVRVIREISWRWREIGADARICDLIDQQLLAIEGGCEHIAAADPKAALGPAFDLIQQQITALDASEAPAAAEPAAAEPTTAATPAAAPAAVPEAGHIKAATASLSAAAAPEPTLAAKPDPGPEPDLAPDLGAEPCSVDEPDQVPAPHLASEPDLAFQPVSSPEPELAVEQEAPAAEISLAISEVEVALQGSEPVDVAAEAKDILAEIADITAETENREAAAQDEAVLQRVAHEMAAPDDGGDEALFEGDDDPSRATASSAGQPILVSPRPELALVAASAPHAVAPATSPEAFAQRPSPTDAQPSRPFSAPTSLGSSLIANGIVRRPTSEADPLAPIRRMSQAEKIAFFS